MSIKDIDLDIENYSIREIRTLFKLDHEHSSDDIQRNVDKLFFTINKSEDLSMAEKKKMCHFFNALKVILIRHLNNNEGMYNNYGNIEEIEPENKVIDVGVSHQYSNGREKSDSTGLINNHENHTTLNHSKSVHDMFRDKEAERNIVENMVGLTETHALKYIKDNLNPIKQQIITKCITFDTRFRENYYATKSTDFKCKIPDRLTNVISMQLAAFEFPTSYFIINESLDNNFFSYQIIDSGNVAEIKTITVSSGNYSHTELITQINDAIINNGDNIVFEVDITNLGSGTGKTIIRNQNTNIINIYFDRDRNGNNDETPLPLKFGWFLGFRNNEYIGNKNYLSEGMYDDHGPRYIYLAINDHNNNTFDTYTSVFNSSILNKNILARISLKTPAFHILNETGMQLVTEPRKYLGPVNISTFNIQILDEFGRVLNINNMDYSFCLNFECLYK
jgi:hypothetical protein